MMTDLQRQESATLLMSATLVPSSSLIVLYGSRFICLNTSLTFFMVALIPHLCVLLAISLLCFWRERRHFNREDLKIVFKTALHEEPSVLIHINAVDVKHDGVSCCGEFRNRKKVPRARPF